MNSEQDTFQQYANMVANLQTGFFENSFSFVMKTYLLVRNCHMLFLPFFAKCKALRLVAKKRRWILEKTTMRLTNWSYQ